MNKVLFRAVCFLILFHAPVLVLGQDSLSLIPLSRKQTYSKPLTTYQDSLLYTKPEKKSFFQKAALPIGLIAGGTLLSKSDFERDFQKLVRQQTGDDFLYRIDDYTRYVPIISIYIADIAGVEAKNHWFDQSKNLFIIGYSTDWITFKIKEWVFKRRPTGRQSNSFPSGHTSFAFVGSSVMYQEFKDTSPWLAYSGHFFAATTGGFRVANNEHFITDVVVGAGIAMLLTELVYHFDPIIPWNPFKKSQRVTFFPTADRDELGFSFSMQF
jgi:membrane-associated phospholipid phosphatase